MSQIAKASITIYDTAPEMTKAVIDLRTADQRKYYPVCMYLVDPARRLSSDTIYTSVACSLGMER